MSEFEGDISAVNIEKELKQSYLDYAMSVIVGRALPDVRDGRNLSIGDVFSRCTKQTTRSTDLRLSQRLLVM